MLMQLYRESLMSGLQRVTHEQDQQAKRNEAYRKELAALGGPRQVMESGRAKDYFFTKLIDRASVKPEHRGRGK